jgi:retron-type reverse transcriptase
VIAWDNLLEAYRRAARGKRGRASTANFEHRLADRLLALQAQLASGDYRPGDYVHFIIHDPKLRKISAAPFADRVVHHAICNVIEPRFERLFIPHSYANRLGKGTHRAVDQLQRLAREHRYVLRLDVVKHFPSMDHAILVDILARHVPEDDLMDLIRHILASGDGVHDELPPDWFPGDDILAPLRPRGLPIGNLTSQFWSNCFLHPLDQHITRGLGCRAYLRYVDDLALFSDSKRELWAWKTAIRERLAELRLRLHEHSAQVMPVERGTPWLGFVVYPNHRRIKARNVHKFDRRLRLRWSECRAGRISFAEFDASVKGWVNHVRYADTWGLRRKLLGRPLPGRPPIPPKAAGELASRGRG